MCNRSLTGRKFDAGGRDDGQLGIVSNDPFIAPPSARACGSSSSASAKCFRIPFAAGQEVVRVRNVSAEGLAINITSSASCFYGSGCSANALVILDRGTEDCRRRKGLPPSCHAIRNVRIFAQGLQIWCGKRQNVINGHLGSAGSARQAACDKGWTCTPALLGVFSCWLQ